MKIEMFEKVDEINIIALRSAEENNAIAKAEIMRRKEEERIRRKQEERENARIANEVLAKLVNAINAKAESGETLLPIEWVEGRSMAPFGISWDDYGKAIKYIKPTLEAAGYQVDDRYSYSNAYARKSGKRGCAYIYW